MGKETLDEVVAFARRSCFKTIDITGGAPELHPHLKSMIQQFSALTDRLLVRSNLSALEKSNPEQLIDIFREYRVGVVASFSSLNKGQAESQRGKGIFEKSLRALQRLNRAGYGGRGTRLELDLISNPTGAFLPPSQKGVEERFRAYLQEKWGIVFNNLFILGNVPLGRFRQWLNDSGNFEKYMERLASSFNPCAVQRLMCRCDFNLAAGLFMGGRKTHVSEMKNPPQPGGPIPVADHCYACAAGSGFT
jgi:radical SAM/Cys-rich protein